MVPEEACGPCDQRFHNTRSVPSGDTKSADGGGGINVVPPPLWPLLGRDLSNTLPGLPPILPANCHFSIVHVSPSWRFAPSTGVVFKTDVHHAVSAARVITGTKLFPRRLLDHLAIRSVMIVRDDVAGTLPPARIERRRAPCRAFQFAFSSQEIEVNWGNHQIVFIQQRHGLAEFLANVRARHM